MTIHAHGRAKLLQPPPALPVESGIQFSNTNNDDNNKNDNNSTTNTNTNANTNNNAPGPPCRDTLSFYSICFIIVVLSIIYCYIILVIYCYIYIYIYCYIDYAADPAIAVHFESVLRRAVVPVPISQLMHLQFHVEDNAFRRPQTHFTARSGPAQLSNDSPPKLRRQAILMYTYIHRHIHQIYTYIDTCIYT